MKSSDNVSGAKGRRAANGARGGAMSADADQVRAVQQALKDQGHDPGEIDGKMGPKTQAALRDYQQKQGLKATGQLDGETSAKLGVESKTSAAPSAAPSISSPAASPSTSAPSSSDSGAKSDTKASTGVKSDTKTDTSAKPSTDTKQPK